MHGHRLLDVDNSSPCCPSWAYWQRLSEGKIYIYIYKITLFQITQIFAYFIFKSLFFHCSAVLISMLPWFCWSRSCVYFLPPCSQLFSPHWHAGDSQRIASMPQFQLCLSDSGSVCPILNLTFTVPSFSPISGFKSLCHLLFVPSPQCKKTALTAGGGEQLIKWLSLSSGVSRLSNSEAETKTKYLEEKMITHSVLQSTTGPR